MSFDDVLGTKKRKIKDKKLKRLLDKRSGDMKTREPPKLKVVRVLEHKPHPTVKMVMDGQERPPRSEKITVYRCEKCGKEFNHTQYQEAMGILPACPICDK